MSPTRGHRAGPDLLGHLGPGADLPRTRIPVPDHGLGPSGEPIYSCDICVRVAPPRRWSLLLSCSGESWFCQAGRAPGCCQEWGPSFQPPVPPIVEARHAWCLSRIRRASRTAGLAVSRGHCLRPRGSIRRALGSNITSKVALAWAAGGTPGWVAQEGCLCQKQGGCMHEGLCLSIRGVPLRL